MGEFFDDKVENFIRYMLGGYVTEKVGKAKENRERRKEENTIQEIVVIAEDLPTKEDYIEAVKEKEKPFQIECNCDAFVMCTNARGESEPLHIKKEEALTHICGEGTLNKLDIELDGHFARCMGVGECCVDRDSIEDGMWKDTNEMDDEGEGKNTLNAEDAYMICQIGNGIIYFSNATQKTKDVVEDWETLCRYVNEETFEKMGWDVEKFKSVYREDAIEQLREYMYQYGITNRYSVCMFLATLGEESGEGSELKEGKGVKEEGEESEEKNKEIFKNDIYGYHTRGAGLIQLTGETQKHFLEYLYSVNGDIGIKEKIDTFKITDIVINGKPKEKYDHPENITDYIAKYYPIESAVWYWAEYKKCEYFTNYANEKKIAMPLNEYVNKIEKKQGGDTFINLFLTTQYYVNGGAWSTERLQKIAECTNDTYKIGDTLTFILPESDPDKGPHDDKLPNGWNDRKEDWDALLPELFG